jgi:hypothetical protein
MDTEEGNYEMHAFLIGEHQFPGKGITIYFAGLTG